MPETCSCGTELVEGALFCHRCGKAQRDLMAGGSEEPVIAVVLPPPPTVAILPPIGFNNSLAVRLCFLVASVASVLDAMPIAMSVGIVMLSLIIWSVTAGFVAVVLYRRATGMSLNIREGAKLGWIAGVFNSLILTVVTTISVVSSSTDSSAAREQLRKSALNDPAALAMADSPYFLAGVVIFGLFCIFVLVSGASVAGGTLGARILRDHRAPGTQPR